MARAPAYTIEVVGACETCHRGEQYVVTGPDGFREEFSERETAVYVLNHKNEAYKAGVTNLLAMRAAGIQRARARGVRFGREPILTPAEQTELRRRHADGETGESLKRAFKVSRATVSRVVNAPKVR